MAPPVRILPLGGLGEIGMNCMAVECDGRIAVVDCGILFPNEPIGVDVITPDLSWLRERRAQVGAIFLTHGHEDHIGALPYILKQINAPVFGSRLTLGLLKNKIREHGLDQSADLREVAAGKPWQLGPFKLEGIRVTHSLMDCLALAVETPAGVVIHTGDFKIDQTPLDGELFDLHRFAELGSAGSIVASQQLDGAITWAAWGGGTLRVARDRVQATISSDRSMTLTTAKVKGMMNTSAIGMLAALYQKPFMIYSVGVGPVTTEEGRRLTRWTFDVADICSVRDQESKDLLMSLGIPEEKVEVVPDPVLTLSFDVPAAADILTAHGIDPTTTPLLGVCVRNWGEEETAKRWKKELAAALDRFLETHNSHVIFIPFQGLERALENDHAAAVDLRTERCRRLSPD